MSSSKFKIKVTGVEKELAKAGKEFNTIQTKEVKKSAYAMSAELALATPVDTGEAQAGWKVRKKTEEAYDVYNDVDHIDELNDGHSKQAPRFFIESIALKYGRPVGIIAKEKE